MNQGLVRQYAEESPHTLRTFQQSGSWYDGDTFKLEDNKWMRIEHGAVVLYDGQEQLGTCTIEALL